MSALLGDAASCLALAATVRRRRAELSARAEELAAARAEAAPGWVGRGSVVHRRRADELVTRVQEVATAMAVLGDRVEACAEALGEAQAELRAVSEAADRQGLRLVDGQVGPALGISGEADPAAALRAEEAAARLQRRLARVLTLLERRRAELAASSAEVTRSLT